MINFISEAFIITNHGILGNIAFIKINGHQYGYETADDRSIEDIYNNYLKIFKHSPGTALAWLKQNTKLSSGSIKGTSKIYTVDNARYRENFHESTSLIKSYAEKSGKTVEEVDALWEKAKTIASKNGFIEGEDDFYAFTVGILKNMLGFSKFEENNSLVILKLLDESKKSGLVSTLIGLGVLAKKDDKLVATGKPVPKDSPIKKIADSSKHKITKTA
jgi:hypothetical protein